VCVISLNEDFPGLSSFGDVIGDRVLHLPPYKGFVTSGDFGVILGNGSADMIHAVAGELEFVRHVGKIANRRGYFVRLLTINPCHDKWMVIIVPMSKAHHINNTLFSFGGGGEFERHVRDMTRVADLYKYSIYIRYFMLCPWFTLEYVRVGLQHLTGQY